MNKKIALIIAIAVIVLAGAGIATAIALNNHGTQKTNQSDTKTSDSKDTPATSNVDPAKEFKPEDITKLSYVATTTTTVSGQTVTSTFENDGKGTQKSSSNYSGIKSESYITGNTVVSCTDGKCTKSTIDPQSSASPDMSKTIEQYRSTAKHLGAETVNGKSYQVWSAAGPMGEVKFYIGSDNRIGRILTGVNTTSDYDYKPVTITVPQV